MLLTHMLVRRIDAMSDLVEHGIVNGFAHILDGLLGIDGGHDLELTRAHLVGRQHANLPGKHRKYVRKSNRIQLEWEINLPPGHLLLVYVHRLRNMIHLRFHLAELLRLQVQQLHVAVGERIDLIRYTGQRLRGVVLGGLEGGLLVVGPIVCVLAVVGHPLQVRVAVAQALAAIGDFGAYQRC